MTSAAIPDRNRRGVQVWGYLVLSLLTISLDHWRKGSIVATIVRYAFLTYVPIWLGFQLRAGYLRRKPYWTRESWQRFLRLISQPVGALVVFFGILYFFDGSQGTCPDGLRRHRSGSRGRLARERRAIRAIHADAVVHAPRARELAPSLRSSPSDTTSPTENHGVGSSILHLGTNAYARGYTFARALRLRVRNTAKADVMNDLIRAPIATGALDPRKKWVEGLRRYADGSEPIGCARARGEVGELTGELVDGHRSRPRRTRSPGSCERRLR
jgi:hypothetical protein